MAEPTLTSAVAVPDDVDHTSSTNGLKRRQSDISGREQEQESKRQRVSPGKSSPSTSRDDADEKEAAQDGTAKEPPADSRAANRKSSVADEKQRSRRLFGALLGNLNQPGDRTSKRRQEIESRRKAELQRQDDDRVEGKQRRQERIAEHRRIEQVKVDEQNMRIRHSNMLNAANFLQTTSEPKLYYRPWDLRPDEQSRIEQQIAEAQAQVDSELQDFEREPKHMPNEGEVNGATTTSPDNNDQSDATKEADPPADSVTADENMTDIEYQAKSANLEESKPAEVPDSDPTNSDPHDPAHTPDGGQTESTDPSKEHVEETEEDVDHVVDGDEDTVIY